ncbi:cytochrome P450 [Rhizophagus irregularis DAOM 181602=DAOM 197198]|uniref:Cytochrome P450 n=1 Tax=Rhizophagus irregularis (strain DAOM 181602 / DAOM 197198 / MUCL 43194) TaxID=747089 RepID=A0A2P4Q986_RHIID|nr:cytochrome P450 [Rhizophagus irregularis DAOM 181602=DAOM 197198]POG74196.1 cytochrome P450 [Rhizophagus irregularis DAOM 181602=DAOM 197198]|eukprot:XP_025181062.1 cytochrome P450 [Rhizophagus irregularis DAOM 181602=DAOM 197198]
MFALIFFAITFGFIINFIRKFNKKPEGLENIPYISFISLLKILWAYFQQKNYDEVEDLVQELIGGHHDIYLSQFGIVLNNPEYAKILLTESEDVAIKYYSKTDNVFFDKFFGCGLSLTNGDKWRSTRKLADSALNLASHQYPEVVGEITMDLFTFMNPNLNRPINIIESMRRISIEALGKFAFGYKFGCLESQEVPRLISVYDYIVSVLGSPFRLVFPWISELPLESNKKYLDAIKEFDGFINDIIETKRNEMKKDSYNATTTALSVSLYFLAKYPEMQEKARAEVIRILGNEPIIPSLDQLKELKYVNAIIKETLRTHPPTPILTVRRLKKPIKVGSYILPINSTCMINTWKIHRDPKYWENPNQYNPERFLSSDEKRDKFAWIPFSAGPRNCVGQNLTLLQQRVVLSMFHLHGAFVDHTVGLTAEKIFDM